MIQEEKDMLNLKKQFNMAQTNQAPIIKGVKWNKTGSPQPFKSGRRADSHDVSFPISGATSIPCIFDDQYDSRMEALKSEMDSLIEYIGHDIEEKGKKEAVARLKKERLNLAQLDLFA